MKQLAFSAWPLSANKEKISESTPRLPGPVGLRLISNYPRGAAAVSSDERWTGGGEGDGSTKLADRDTERGKESGADDAHMWSPDKIFVQQQRGREVGD